MVTATSKGVRARKFEILQNVFFKVSRYVIWKRLSNSLLIFDDTPSYSGPLFKAWLTILSSKPWFKDFIVSSLRHL